MKSFIVSLAFVCTAIISFAQNEPVTAIRPLTIGDTVPDIEFNNLINYHSTTARLSDFKGKLVILDFWATWCGACIGNFGKLESLQNKFADKIQVILVNSKKSNDDLKKIETLFSRLRTETGRPYLFPIMVKDTILTSFFEYKMIPHYVWIMNGAVMAITSSFEVTEDNITKVLDHEKVELVLKKDIDTKTPIYIDADVPYNQLEHYSIFMKGRIDGLPSSNIYRKHDSILYGRAMTNTSLITIFSHVGKSLIEGFRSSRIILNVKKPSELIYDERFFDKNEWFKKYSYTYELIVPIKDASKLYQYMLEDLNKYSGYHGEVVKKKVNCLVLTLKNDFEKKNISDKTETGKYNKMIHLMNKLNQQIMDIPIVDETNYVGYINISIDSIFGNIESLQRILSKNGIKLSETQREIDMFVISEN